MKEPTRKIRDKDFAKRLNDACDNHSEVPPYNYGRLTWIRDQLSSKYSEKITTETVRKWFAGEARPRREKMKKLAALLKVEEAWLSLASTVIDSKHRATRQRRATGAANILAGFIQLTDDSAIAFPDESAIEDFTAIINHKKYDMYAALAVEKNGSYIFYTPINHKQLTVIGVIPTKGNSVIFLKFPPAVIEKEGRKKGDHIEVAVKKITNNYKCNQTTLLPIYSFAEGI